MAQEKPKVLAIIVYLPIDLALEMYRESGDLPISTFPSTLKFAEIIAETLDIDQIKNEKDTELTFASQSEKKVSISISRKQ